jgi:hypothetical protein
MAGIMKGILKVLLGLVVLAIGLPLLLLVTLWAVGSGTWKGIARGFSHSKGGSHDRWNETEQGTGG